MTYDPNRPAIVECPRCLVPFTACVQLERAIDGAETYYIKHDGCGRRFGLTHVDAIGVDARRRMFVARSAWKIDAVGRWRDVLRQHTVNLEGQVLA